MLAKRILYGVLFLSSVLLLWRMRAPDLPGATEGAIRPSSLHTNTSGTVASREKAKRNATGGKGMIGLSVEISPKAFFLGQATQTVNLDYETFSKFTAKDVDYLNKCYRERTNLTDRAELTRVLGVIGNEQSVQLFIHCLMEEQAGRVFSEPEMRGDADPEFVLWTTVLSLGKLASRFDSAFAFLKPTVRPEFWSAAINWQSSLGDESVGSMTNWAIQALGNTGRDEAREILAELLKNKPTPWPPGKKSNRTFDGAIISAAFRLDYIQTYGLEVSMAGRGPEAQFAYAAWSKSEKGKMWITKKP